MTGLSRSQFWLLNGIGIAVLALVITNITLFVDNRESQAQIAANQQLINQGTGISRLNNELIKALATASAQTGDAKIRELLATHGVTFTINNRGEQPTTTQGGAQ